MKLTIILFIIKLFARIIVFKYATKKDGQIVKIIRSLEQVKWHYSKGNEDIRFIKTCKKEDLLPKFDIVQKQPPEVFCKNWSS